MPNSSCASTPCTNPPRPTNYRLPKWRALNSEYFQHWQKLEGIAEKFVFFENILVAHIPSFARAVAWQLDQCLELKITHLAKEEWIYFKDIKMRYFTLDFGANVLLPNFIGLGKGAGVGLAWCAANPRPEKNIPCWITPPVLRFLSPVQQSFQRLAIYLSFVSYGLTFLSIEHLV